MSYRPELVGHAIAQFQGLPSAAMSAFARRTAELVEAPWDGARIAAPGIDPAEREALFDSGRGFLCFRVDDAREVIQVFRIVWA